MKTIFKILLILTLLVGITWFVWKRTQPAPDRETNHQVLIERIESMGKLELVKYRFSDIIEHKNIREYLPEASVLLIVKADAVGCVDLGQLSANDVTILGDSVTIRLPEPEICYVRIDHKASRVYDTKMAFFREASLVDEAFKAAETEITEQVRKSDILKQTQDNAIHVLRPLIQGLGYSKFSLTFQ